MARRLELHALLKAIPGVTEVYFQPPPTVTLTYPCIVYSMDDEDAAYADNLPYRRIKRYQITVMDRSPDSTIIEAIADMESASFSRAFTLDQLHQTVYQLYF